MKWLVLVALVLAMWVAPGQVDGTFTSSLVYIEEQVFESPLKYIEPLYDVDGIRMHHIFQSVYVSERGEVHATGIWY